MEFYKWLEISLTADPRTASWPLLSSPLPTIILVLFYFLFVFLIGPRIMANRHPIDFGLLLPAYNIVLVALNCYVLKEALVGSYNAGYSFVCTPLKSDSYDPYEIMVANSVWWYYFSKIAELVDTIWFVFKKNSRQLTVLHVYHHSTMPLIWWLGAKYNPGGQMVVPIILNSAVHTVMYMYYGLAAFGSEVRKYLWWKKYLTVLQLIQFFVAICHSSISLYVECPSPAWIHWSLIAYTISMVILFSNFYVHAYFTRPKKQDVLQNGHASVAHAKLPNNIEKEVTGGENLLKMRSHSSLRARRS